MFRLAFFGRSHRLRNRRTIVMSLRVGSVLGCFALLFHIAASCDYNFDSDCPEGASVFVLRGL